MKTIFLKNAHADRKAKLTNFGGFEMPLSYGEIKQEVLAIRNNVGVFDVSHMGIYEFEGKESQKAIDYLITNNFIDLPLNKAVYGMLCDENAKIIDDIIAYKLTAEKSLMVVNAGNRDKDWNWITSNIKKFDVKITDRTHEMVLMAIQGPKAIKTLSEIFHDDRLENYPSFSINFTKFEGHDLLIAKTGYTGEAGFEAFVPQKIALSFWNKLMESNVTPCGLAARDVLRLEACYPLYGQEIDSTIGPYDAGLGWAVKLERNSSFIGKDALIKNKAEPEFILKKFVLENGIPRSHYKIFDEYNNIVGEVTSGGFSVVLEKGVAICRLNKKLITKSKTFFVEIRNQKYQGIEVNKNFLTLKK